MLQRACGVRVQQYSPVVGAGKNSQPAQDSRDSYVILQPCFAAIAFITIVRICNTRTASRRKLRRKKALLSECSP